MGFNSGFKGLNTATAGEATLPTFVCYVWYKQEAAGGRKQNHGLVI